MERAKLLCYNFVVLSPFAIQKCIDEFACAVNDQACYFLSPRRANINRMPSYTKSFESLTKMVHFGALFGG
jgi:hypothetical protein